MNANELKEAIQNGQTEFIGLTIYLESGEEDLPGYDFVGITFKDVAFVCAHFVSSAFLKVTFENVKMCGIYFKKSILTKCSFINSDLKASRFSKSSVINCEFTGCQMSNTIFEKDTIINCSKFNSTKVECSYFKKTVISNSQFIETNLINANFNAAHCRNTTFYTCDLNDATFEDADLEESVFNSICNAYNTNFSGAHMPWVTLMNCDFRDSNFGRTLNPYSGLRAPNILNTLMPLACPEKGAFTCYKIADNHIVVLKVPEYAKRSSAYSLKCRCNTAKVVAILNLDGSSSDKLEVHSDFDSKFVYRINEIVKVDNFDEDRYKECAPGIHFFMTVDEVMHYAFMK